MSLASDTRDFALFHIGEDSSSISATALAYVLAKVNAVGQRLNVLGPSGWFNEKAAGDRLRAPTVVSSVTLTEDSKSVSAVGFASWMHGCTVKIDGTNEWNRIFQTGASTYELLMPSPITNAGGGSMTVYHDCLTLSDTPILLLHVRLEGYPGYLDPANHPDDLEGPQWGALGAYSDSPPISTPLWINDRTIDVPRSYAIDGTQLYSGSYVAQLRVNPLPNQEFRIRWRQRDKFVKLANFSDTRTTITPHEYHESVFLPLVAESLITHPGFEGDKDQVKEDAAEARRVIEALNRPQRQRNTRLLNTGVY